MSDTVDAGGLRHRPAGVPSGEAPKAEAPSAVKPTVVLPQPASSSSTGYSLLSILLILAILGFFTVAIIVAVWLYQPMMKAYRNTRAADHESEKYFANSDGSMGTFPSINDTPTLSLTVVVPAYNEEERMREGLNEMVAFLSEKQTADEKFTWEIIIVNDGSRDKTKEIALNEYVGVQGSDKVRLLDCFKNGGKGAAVRKGVLRARGKLVLMADADGATAFGDFVDLRDALKKVASSSKVVANGAGGSLHGFALGSRINALGGEKAAKRSPLRRFLMWGFHSAISLMLGGTSIGDTQCGFKLFTRATARELFTLLHIERWAFDVELVYIAARLGVPMVEVPVKWHEVAGSKLDPSTASIQMLRDIIVIRLAYLAGFWKI